MPETPFTTTPSAVNGGAPSEPVAQEPIDQFDPDAHLSQPPSEPALQAPRGADGPSKGAPTTTTPNPESEIIQLGGFRGTRSEVDRMVRNVQAEADRMRNELTTTRKAPIQTPAPPAKPPQADPLPPSPDDWLNDPAEAAKKLDILNSATIQKRMDELMGPVKKQAEEQRIRHNHQQVESAWAAFEPQIKAKFPLIPENLYPDFVKKVSAELEQNLGNYGEADEADWVTKINPERAAQQVIGRYFHQLAKEIEVETEKKVMARLKGSTTENAALRSPSGATGHTTGTAKESSEDRKRKAMETYFTAG